jgi:TetR/AcrR family transcriptional regulator
MLTQPSRSKHNKTTPLPRKRERRKDARPDEIIDAALDVFASKGFSAAKLDDIAARAGISKGTLYLYFASKEELLKEVVRLRVVSMLARGRELIAAYEGSTSNLLHDFMMEWWTLQGETKLSAIPKIIMSEAGNFPEIAQFYHQEVIEPAHVMLHTLLKRGVDSGEFAPINDYDDAIHTVISGVQFVMNWQHSIGACIEDSHIEPRRFITNFARIITLGFAVRTDEIAMKTARKKTSIKTPPSKTTPKKAR